MKQDLSMLLEQKTYGVRELYDQYAGMLLGYYFEITRNLTLAEEYLIGTFNILPQHLQQINKEGTNVWLYLQQLAKVQMSVFLGGLSQTLSINKYTSGNKYLLLMDDRQRIIFCNAYYQGKTAEQIAKELNTTENLVRKTLKEAFAIIKSVS